MISTTVSQKAQQSSSFSLKNTVQTVFDSLASFKKSVTDNQLYIQAQQYKKTVHLQFCVPVGHVWKQSYKQLPEELTKFKFSYLNQFSEKERIMFLNVLTLGACLFTFRGLRANQIIVNSFRSIKNSAIMYLLGGLLIAPQIYNPMMKRE